MTIQSPVYSCFLIAIFGCVVVCAPSVTHAQATGQPRVSPPSPASAVHAPASDDQMPSAALVYKAVTVLRYNPQGAQERLSLGVRKRLTDSQHVLRKNTFAYAGLTAMLTPAMQRIGARVEVQPLAILKLYAAAEWVWYMGNFDFVTSYKDAAQDYSDTALKAAGDAGTNYASSGMTLSAGALLQAKVGPLALRSDNLLQHWRMPMHNQDPVFYDPFYDLLTPSRGWTLVQNNDLLYVKGRLVVGLRHTMSRSLLPKKALEPVAADQSPRDVTHRVGPFAAYRLTAEGKYADRLFRRPTLVVLTQWWLQHPYRTGQDVSGGVPWIAFVLAFDGRLSTL